jgi:hypothetical protein
MFEKEKGAAEGAHSGKTQAEYSSTSAEGHSEPRSVLDELKDMELERESAPVELKVEFEVAKAKCIGKRASRPEILKELKAAGVDLADDQVVDWICALFAGQDQ